MEYLDSKHRKIGEMSEKQLQEITAKAQVTKEKKPESFKLYHTPSKKEKEGIKEEEKVKIKPIKKKKFVLSGVNLTERMMFMDNMSTMLKAGLALSPALKTIAKETKNKYFKEVVESLARHVENGQVLSKGMKAYPKVFSEMITATIEVGESTGMLADSFGHLAEILKAEKKLRSKVISALMYPSIVLVALIGVSAFLAFFVFPQLVGMFESAGVNLPFVLKAVQAINHFFAANGWYTLGGTIVAIFLLRMLFRLPGPKLRLHMFWIKVPFVGNLIKELSLTRFAGNLNALLAAGLAIVGAMEIVAKTVGNLQYRYVILDMGKELEKGTSLGRAMASRPKLFPSLTIQLCEVGETTGELENILKKISTFYEERVDNVLTNLSATLEPVLLLLVGVAVGFIAVSVIGPMYELTNTFAN
jgi:type IV pilus assembly protein PilC